MKGNVIKYERDNIDTDVIIPGTYLKIHDYNELAKHAMEGLDPEFHSKVKDGDFLLAGKNLDVAHQENMLQLPFLHVALKQ